MDEDDTHTRLYMHHVYIVCVYVYVYIYKEGNPAICDSIGGSWGHCVKEVSQTDKDKYLMIALICEI